MIQYKYTMKRFVKWATIQKSVLAPLGSLLICSVLFFGYSTSQEREVPPAERYVVIISIDGVPAEYLRNEEIPLPTIRSLAEEGASAAAMRPSSPTKTWANHTSLTTGVHPGKHRVFTNGKFTEVDGKKVIYQNDLDRQELSTYPTIYDRAHQADLRTAGVNWPVTRNAETLHDNFPDAPKRISNMTRNLRSELVESGLLRIFPDTTFQHGSPPGADHTWTSTATHLIQSRMPNLLLFHLLNVDTMHHRHTASSWPGYTAMAYADTQVQRILAALEDAGVRQQTTVFVVSDHGFADVDKIIHPNVLLRQVGLLEANESGDVKRARVQVKQNGGSAMVFETDLAKDGDLETARSLLEGAEGIERIVDPADYDSYGLSRAPNEDRMGDLLLEGAPGYAFGDSTRGDYVVSLDETIGKHGYTSKAPGMNTLFVASGRSVRSGVELDTIDIRSVAPTAARLLGIDLDTAQGEVLETILK